jgi:hypothetical protein
MFRAPSLGITRPEMDSPRWIPLKGGIMAPVLLKNP